MPEQARGQSADREGERPATPAPLGAGDHRALGGSNGQHRFGRRHGAQRPPTQTHPGDTAAPKLALQQAMPRSHQAAGAGEGTGAKDLNGSCLEAEPGLVPIWGNDLLMAEHLGTSDPAAQK